MNKNLLKIYKELEDPLYINRFIDFKLSQRNRRKAIFTANGSTVKCLISGLLKELKTEKLYESLSEWFNSTLSDKDPMWFMQGDETILKYIYHKEGVTLYDLFCNVTDSDLLYFTDMKYRIFAMFSDLKKRVKHYLDIDAFKEDAYEILTWHKYQFAITISTLKKYDTAGTCTVLDLLNAYESGNITDLYYFRKDTNELHKIC